MSKLPLPPCPIVSRFMRVHRAHHVRNNAPDCLLVGCTMLAFSIGSGWTDKTLAPPACQTRILWLRLPLGYWAAFYRMSVFL